MSNCITFPGLLSIPLFSEDFDLSTLQKDVQSAEKGSTSWWYMQGTLSPSESNKSNLDWFCTTSKSSHSWRSFKACLSLLAKYAKNTVYYPAVPIHDTGYEPDVVHKVTLTINAKPKKHKNSTKHFPIVLIRNNQLIVSWKTQEQINTL